MLNLLLVASEIDSATLEKVLTNGGVNTVRVEHSLSFIPLVKEIHPDAVVFNLDTPSEQLLADLIMLNRQSPLPMIMFATDGSNATIHKVIQAEVSEYVVDGLDYHRINTIIQIAIARFKHQQMLKNALHDARTQLEDRKMVDRAKAILINTQNFTENEAYHTLRKLAMDRNITLGQMARNVISMAELLK
ncbi:ANTAR domain-containing protein [Methylomicrobium sp. Wu6]|uniref:ANTAR domain-containing response regulator n=1 Tax=Methylomicrobium sp. Wu6 TaxID=3107928 RepID=UPI002DD632E0|nr:ANTAR domain-containing protein [Methylomicrobium sp. Wu6]MEC4747539.1 ANTAR domain-containing protein [Methylomicrobium sp. Wu6]